VQPTALAFDRRAAAAALYVATDAQQVARLDLRTGTVAWVSKPAHTAMPASSSLSRALAPPRHVTWLDVHPVLPQVVAAYADAAVGVCVFHADTGEALRSQPSHSSATTALALDAGGLALATAGNDGDVRVWSADAGTVGWRNKVREAAAEAGCGRREGGGRLHPHTSAVFVAFPYVARVTAWSV